MPERCEHLKSDGSRCKAAALPDDCCCFFHSPRTEGRRRAARKRGGRERSRKAAVLPEGTAAIPAETLADLAKLVAETINQTRRGELDAKVANAIGYLASVQQRILQVGPIEERLAALEAKLSNGGGK